MKAVLQRVETGKVGLDDPVSDRVRSFRVKGQETPTVRQLVSHTWGLANPIPVSWIHLVDEPGPTLEPTKARDCAPLPIGLGWHLEVIGNEPMAFHLGGGGGFRSELRIYPRLNYAIAVVSNETGFNTAAFANLVVRQ